MTRCLLVPLALVALALADDPKGKDLPVVFEEDFEKGAAHWEIPDAKAWKVVETKKGHVFSQFEKQSNYKPPHRSPLHIALVKDVLVGDFVLEAKVQSTVKDYGHRDACLFFGYQDAAHFYYVHLGKKTDDHANQVFIVNKADRKKISTRTTPGTDWDDEWHQIRVVRKVGDGTIEVYFDDMKKPVMTARDATFSWGQVGVGSFDDTTNWDDVTLRGMKVRRPAK
jgi:hypothetical protein